MDFANLPLHELSMDEAPPSKIIAGAKNSNSNSYVWALTETERAHIADMLKLNGKPEMILPLCNVRSLNIVRLDKELVIRGNLI